MRKVLAISALLLASAIAGCGGSYTCCNNGSYYSCSTREAADVCAQKNDFSNCTRNSEKDNFCKPT